MIFFRGAIASVGFFFLDRCGFFTALCIFNRTFCTTTSRDVPYLLCTLDYRIIHPFSTLLLFSTTLPIAIVNILPLIF